VTFHHYFEKEEIGANVRLCTKLTLPPGVSIGSHRHDSEDELFVVTRGKGLLDDGDTQTLVEAGDTMLTRSGESHAISNCGNEDLEIVALIMCY